MEKKHTNFVLLNPFQAHIRDINELFLVMIKNNYLKTCKYYIDFVGLQCKLNNTKRTDSNLFFIDKKNKRLC